MSQMPNTARRRRRGAPRRRPKMGSGRSLRRRPRTAHVAAVVREATRTASTRVGPRRRLHVAIRPRRRRTFAGPTPARTTGFAGARAARLRRCPTRAAASIVRAPHSRAKGFSAGTSSCLIFVSSMIHGVGARASPDIYRRSLGSCTVSLPRLARVGTPSRSRLGPVLKRLKR